MMTELQQTRPPQAAGVDGESRCTMTKEPK